MQIGPRGAPPSQVGSMKMCERDGHLSLADWKAMDLGRRSFLRSTAVGSLALAIGPGLLSTAAHAAESHVRSTYGSGFCNLNFYLTNALQTAQDEGLILDFVTTPTFAEQVTFL